MTYKSMKERWEDDKAIDFIVELPAYELESLDKDEIVKFNPYHDKRGRFASKNGSGVSGAVASVGGTTKEEDDAYMAAVNSGDMETAQRMLREKAERMGVEMFDTVETTSYKIRTDAPPTQTVKAYKVFFVDENGDPSALFVEGTSALPKGVWLDAQDAFHFQADNGKMYTPSRKNPNSDGSGKTGASIKIPNDEVRQQLIDQGFLPEGSTAKNVVALAYRPGWHAGDLPFFPQGGKLGNPQYNESGEENKRYDPSKPTTNYANIHRRNQVVFEVELAADTNYTQTDTIKSGQNKGKTKYTDMQEMPANGYYEFATNPLTSQNDLGKWYISGSMKINRALSQEECDEFLTRNGFKVQEWEGGTMSLDKLNVNPNKTDKYKKLPNAVTYDDDGNVIPLSQRMDPNSADVRKVKDISNGGELNLKQDEFTNNSFSIYKADEDKRLIFGWASVAVRTDGEQVVDLQKDMIDPEDLEEAVYDYVLEFRDSGEEHIADLRKKGRMVESVIFTKEKMKAMGIPEGVVPEGWWIGFYIDDDDAWEKVKNGTYQMFSIEGQGVREEVKDPEPPKVAKSFKEIIEKFNPWHDRLGRFTSGGGGGAAFHANPHTKAGQMAIARESEKNPLIGAAYQRDYGETGTGDAIKEWAKKENSLKGFIDENGKLTPEREKLHKEIIDDILRDKAPEAGQATMTMMGGGPASGKSSVIDNGFVQLTDEKKTVTIDPDFLKSKLPGYEEMAMKTDSAAGFYHEESSALAKRLYAVALSENINVVYDGTGDGSFGSATGKIKQAKEMGYKVKGEYVTIDTAEALRRNQKRYEDGVRKYESGESKTPPRLPDESLVVDTHMKVTDIAVACASMFDTINIYDNNGAKGSTKLIATGGGGKGLTAVDQTAFNKFLAKGSGAGSNFKTLPDGQVVPK